MNEKNKTTKYPSGNKKTDISQDGDTLVTKHFYDAKNAYVRELIYLKDGVQEIKYYTEQGVLSKVDHYVEEKRHGLETKYLVSKANSVVKSTKIYDNGKLHGENITYNPFGLVIKHEVFALGKRVLKYTRDTSENSEISSVEIIDKEGVINLPKEEYDKLQSYIK